MKTLLTTLFLGLALLVGVSASQPQRPNYEYKFEYKISQGKANELSAQGWEFVTVGTDQAGSSTVSFMVFRRTK